jgi:hypothetical protein
MGSQIDNNSVEIASINQTQKSMPEMVPTSLVEVTICPEARGTLGPNIFKYIYIFI